MTGYPDAGRRAVYEDGAVLGCGVVRELEAGVAGEVGGLGAGLDAQFGEDVGDVAHGRFGAGAQAFGDLAVAESIHQEAKDIEFPGGQTGQCGGTRGCLCGLGRPTT